MGTAASALVAALGNAIALIIKARNDRTVNTAMSTDIVKLARNGGNTDVSTLHTPALVPPSTDTPPQPEPASGVGGAPAG